MTPSRPRNLAAEVLRRVEGGAYAGRLLRATLDRATLEARDRALVTEMVYGVLRHQGEIDAALNSLSRQPITALPASVRSILRVAAYQLLFLDRIPDRAAVHEAVEAVKAVSPKHAGYVNAVLRRLATGETRPEATPPAWLASLWGDAFGPGRARELWDFFQTPAPVSLRTNILRLTRDELLERLRREGVPARSGDLSPFGILVERGGPPEELPGFAEGLFTVQDESSQLVAPALAPDPDGLIIDLCAGSGGKSTQLAELRGDAGEVLAVDLYPAKLRALEESAARLGLRSIRTLAADARRVDLPPTERILVDAPCSGLGVLRRRPEIAHRLRPEDPVRLAGLSRAILANAARALLPGGILLFSTCTLNPGENEEVVLDFLASHPDFALDDLRPYLPALLRSEEGAREGMLTVWPPRVRADGFFLARLRRRL